MSDRRPLRVAVFVKQVPRAAEMTLAPDGRIARTGVDAELNAYCRRAVAQGVEMADASGGTCSVFTLGPPPAEACLREAIAWGANDGVLISSPEFRGSDTLATARALAACFGHDAPFDLVLVGRNSVDADTGQVGPQLAELLDLPFLGGARRIDVRDNVVTAQCEHDDGWVVASTELPAVISCAERLCAPAKVEAEGRDAVPAQLIRRVTAHDLGPGPWGQAGSPTRVGNVRSYAVARRGVILEGPLIDQVGRAVDLIRSFDGCDGADSEARAVRVPDGWVRGQRLIVVVCEPDRLRESRELLCAAARVARDIGGRVTAIDLGDSPGDELGSWGADEVLRIEGAAVEQDIAHAIADWSIRTTPWAVLSVGTMWGREVASRLAVRLGAGLTGDAIDLSVMDDRLVGWKPAFGGQLVAAVTSVSPTQLLTIRPGVLPEGSPRAKREVPTHVVHHRAVSRLRRLDGGRVDDIETLARARVVIGVGAGVDPGDYHLLETLRATVNGQLAATRKVTDAGSLPRSRQLGLTGRSISPALYIAVGMSGKFNHTIGFRGAQTVLAINVDRSAPIFDAADLGVVADWRDVVPLLAEALADTPLLPSPTKVDPPIRSLTCP